jgi:hypothetical protein
VRIAESNGVGLVVFSELDCVGSENGLITIVTELSNGEEGMIADGREHVGTASGDGEGW